MTVAVIWRLPSYVESLVQTLGFRHIGIVNEEYAVSTDAMKMFGVLDLTSEMDGLPICHWHSEFP
jgi:hypothetical protein